jgi:hypothetical protein
MNTRFNTRIQSVRSNEFFSPALLLDCCRIDDNQAWNFQEVRCIARDKIRLFHKRGSGHDCIRRFDFYLTSQFYGSFNNLFRDRNFMKLCQQNFKPLLILGCQPGKSKNLQPAHRGKAAPINYSGLEQNSCRLWDTRHTFDEHIGIKEPAHQRSPQSRRSRSSHSARTCRSYAAPSTSVFNVPRTDFIFSRSGLCACPSRTVSSAFPVAGNLSGSETVMSPWLISAFNVRYAMQIKSSIKTASGKASVENLPCWEISNQATELRSIFASADGVSVPASHFSPQSKIANRKLQIANSLPCPGSSIIFI